jgi:hypothetical protein
MLGVLLNRSKHQRCKQSMEYSGFLFDSFRGVMLCLDEKLALLRAHCAELSSSTDPWSMRDLDRVKGRLLHYSAGVRHLRIRVTQMQCLMGLQSPRAPCLSARPHPFAPTAAASYNRPDPLPAGLAELAVEMDDLILHYGPLVAPLWPPIASSAYALVLSGEEKLMFCALTWDASPDDWAALGRWWALSGRDWAPRELLPVGSWSAGLDVSE